MLVSVKIQKFISNIFFVAIIGYYAQGALYPTGTIISQFLLITIVGICLIYFLSNNIEHSKKSLFYKAWTILWIINILGFLLSGQYSNSHHFGMIKGVLMSSLPFYPVYFFTKHNIIRFHELIGFSLLTLIVLVLQFYYSIDILQNRFSKEQDLVVNISYTFAALIPYVFLYKKNIALAYSVMAVLLFFIILGSKRGAFITGVVGLFLYFYYQIKTVSKKHQARSYLLIILGVVTIGYFLYTTYISNEYLITRLHQLDEDQGSGRIGIFSKLITDWLLSDSYTNLIFGKGFAASLTIAGNFAHNDWLELLSNFGLMGFSTYLLLFYSSTKNLHNRTWSAEKKILLFTVILMWFSTSLYSMGYTNISNGYLRAIILGYLLGGGNTLK